MRIGISSRGNAWLSAGPVGWIILGPFILAWWVLWALAVTLWMLGAIVVQAVREGGHG